MNQDEKLTTDSGSQAPAASAGCERCLKPANLCVCKDLPQLSSRLQVVILQHPQEPDKLLGSALLAHLALTNSMLMIGLSWPNLKTLLGREADPSRWAVLYLGSGARLGAHGSGARLGAPTAGPRPRLRAGIHFVTKNAELLDDAAQAQIRKNLEGILVLDGTWSQAKTLWWRNAWLLKLRRAILIPESKSLYGELRRESREECLSTIETIAECLRSLGEHEEVSAQLREIFAKLLQQYRAGYSRAGGSGPGRGRRRHGARHRRGR